MLLFKIFFLCFILLFSGLSNAEEISSFAPMTPKALGQECVRDTNFMRLNHMDFLYEKRDLVVLKGIRSKPESFNMCLTCHGVKAENGSYISYEEPKHFCRTCHDFAAVKIDCFECHSSVPDQPILTGNKNGHE